MAVPGKWRPQGDAACAGQAATAQGENGRLSSIHFHQIAADEVNRETVAACHEHAKVGGVPVERPIAILAYAAIHDAQSGCTPRFRSTIDC